jgi:hypothetical protein
MLGDRSSMREFVAQELLLPPPQCKESRTELDAARIEHPACNRRPQTRVSPEGNILQQPGNVPYLGPSRGCL